MNTLLKFKNLNKNVNNELTLSDKEYTIEINKILSYLFSVKKISKLMLFNIKHDEEIFSYIKHALMHADWKFDNTKKVKLGTWRIKCILWEIYRIINTHAKNQKCPIFSFSDIEHNDSYIAESIKDDTSTEINDEIIYQNIINTAEKILSKYDLMIFKEYFENNNTITNIARTYEISYSKTKNIIHKSTRKIQDKLFG